MARSFWLLYTVRTGKINRCSLGGGVGEGGEPLRKMGHRKGGGGLLERAEGCGRLVALHYLYLFGKIQQRAIIS